MTLYCKGCKKHKPESEFWRALHSADGHQHKCKSCMRELYDGSPNYKPRNQKPQPDPIVTRLADRDRQADAMRAKLAQMGLGDLIGER